MAMNKDEFIAAVAKQANVSTVQAEAAIDAIGVVAARQLAADGAVRVPGLANIAAKQCAARPGRNLRTMEACIIPEAVRIRISASAPLKAKFEAEKTAQIA
jgi:DNA-binding protein HU-beta